MTHTHRWDLEICVSCSNFCSSIFMVVSPPLSQMELQDDGVMLGLDSSLGKDIVGIINNVFQAPWGGSHTCQKDEKALECSLCQSSILCYQLGCELLERLTPREEIRLVVRHTACIFMHQLWINLVHLAGRALEWVHVAPRVPNHSAKNNTVSNCATFVLE